MSSPAAAISANASFARRSRISPNDVMIIPRVVRTKERFADEASLKITQRLRHRRLRQRKLFCCAPFGTTRGNAQKGGQLMARHLFAEAVGMTRGSGLRVLRDQFFFDRIEL